MSLNLSVSPVPRPQVPFPSFPYRANIVIGDIFEPGCQQIVDAINGLPADNGKAVWKRCDVTNWEDQVALFELAMTRFGGVDIVVSLPSCLVCIVEWYQSWVSARRVRTADRRC